MAKDTFYFSHDYNSRNDIKIKRLLQKLGFEGYGLFWAIIEELYNNANALPTHYEGIAFDMRTHEDLVKSVVEDFDLFVVHEGNFGSISVERRINERNEKSKKAKNSADFRWSNANESKKDANEMRTQCDGNAIKKERNKEVKEIKKVDANAPIPIYSERSMAALKYISEKCPTVAKMKLPLTHLEAEKLIDEFGKDLVKEYLNAMENYVPLLSKSKSANLTIRKWIKRDNKAIVPHKIPSGVTAN